MKIEQFKTLIQNSFNTFFDLDVVYSELSKIYDLSDISDNDVIELFDQYIFANN